jgi:hypothetical protein
MKKFLIFIMLPFILISCFEDSTGPVIKDGIYTFSSVSDETFTVYGKNGVVIPESEWDEQIKVFTDRAEAEMNNEMGYLEDFSFELNDGKIKYNDGNIEYDVDYYIEDDIIIMSLDIGSNSIDIPFALKIDDSTIEMQAYSFGYHTDFSTEYTTGNDLGGYESAMDEYSDYFESMQEEDIITAYLKKIHYKKQ